MTENLNNKHFNFLIEKDYIKQQKVNKSYQTAPENLQFFWRTLYHKIKENTI